MKWYFWPLGGSRTSCKTHRHLENECFLLAACMSWQNTNNKKKFAAPNYYSHYYYFFFYQDKYIVSFSRSKNKTTTTLISTFLLFFYNQSLKTPERKKKKITPDMFLLVRLTGQKTTGLMGTLRTLKSYRQMTQFPWGILLSVRISLAFWRRENRIIQ